MSEKKKEFILHSEWVAAKVYAHDSDIIDELNFIIDGEPEGGCEYGFLVKFREVGDSPTVEVEVFGDALKAFTECREVFSLLANAHNAIQSLDAFHELVKQIEKL